MTKKRRMRLNRTLRAKKPYTLSIHGYKIVVVPNNSRLISVQSYVFSGFIVETPSTLGINHLLEHVLANAYTPCRKFDCYSYLRDNALNSNASTSNNVLNYYVNGFKTKLEKMVDYIVNITTRPVFDDAMLAREKTAVANELYMYKDNPISKTKHTLHKHLYKIYGLQNMDNYDKQIENLSNITTTTLAEYYHKTYGSTNTIFVVSGTVNLSTIKHLFSTKLPASHKVKVPRYSCFTYKPQTHFLHNPKLTSTQILIAYPTKIRYNSPEIPPLQLGVDMLRHRLFIRLRVVGKLIYGIQASITTNICGTSVEFLINTKNENVQAVLDGFKATLRDISQLESSMQPTKQLYLTNYKSTYFNSQDLANLIGIQAVYRHILNTDLHVPTFFKEKYIGSTFKHVERLLEQTISRGHPVCVVSNSRKQRKYRF